MGGGVLGYFGVSFKIIIEMSFVMFVMSLRYTEELEGQCFLGIQKSSAYSGRVTEGRDGE